jgi:hypothetical protein
MNTGYQYSPVSNLSRIGLDGAPWINPWSHDSTRLRLRLRRGYPPQLRGDIAP